MSAIELESLKEQIKRELIAEGYSMRPTIRVTPWLEVKDELEFELTKTQFKNDEQAKYGIAVAFHTVIHKRFGVRHVHRLTADQAKEALGLVKPFLELFGNDHCISRKEATA